MPDLAALAERLEKATGPDRELDADISVVLLGGEIQWKQTRFTGESYPARKYASRDHVGGFAVGPVELLTASIDAALALVEKVLPGWSWQIGTYARVGISAQLAEPISTEYGPAIGQRADVKAPTAPLAILIALLRTLSKGTDHD